jgi:hypothetical protein
MPVCMAEYRLSVLPLLSMEVIYPTGFLVFCYHVISVP